MGIKPKYIASPVNCLLNHFLGYKSNTKTNTHSIPSMLVKSLVLRTKEAQKSSQHRLWSNNASNNYEFQLQLWLATCTTLTNSWNLPILFSSLPVRSSETSTDYN